MYHRKPPKSFGIIIIYQNNYIFAGILYHFTFVHLVPYAISIPPQCFPFAPISAMPSYMPSVFYTVRLQGYESALIS